MREHNSPFFMQRDGRGEKIRSYQPPKVLHLKVIAEINIKTTIPVIILVCTEIADC